MSFPSNNFRNDEFTNENIKNGFYKKEIHDCNCSFQNNFLQKEIQLLKNQIMEKDLIMNKLNFQILKNKEDYNKLINDDEIKNIEIKELKQNIEKNFNEDILKNHKLNEMMEKNLFLESENYVNYF